MSLWTRAVAVVALCGGLIISGLESSSAQASRSKTGVHPMMAQATQAEPRPLQAQGRRNGETSRAPETSEAAKQEEGQEARFAITSYEVDGNTILDAAKIEEVLTPYKGSQMRIADVEKARGELEKVYHAAGYPTVLVNLPEQTIEGGIVKLLVVEARLLNITVTGNEHYSWVNIREKLPSLTPGALIYEPTFLRELAVVNGNPDLKVVPALKPGKEQGTVDLELKVKDRLPVHGKLEGDNKGPITTPRDRLVAEIQHTNWFGRDEILTVNTVQTPTDWGQVENYGVSFVYPVIWPNHLLAVYASHSKSNSVLAGAAVSLGGAADVGIAGNATVAGLRYIFPIFSGSKNTHQLSIGMDYKNLKQTDATFPDGGTAVVLGPLQYTPMSGGYTGFFPDQWWPERVGQTKLSFMAKGYVAGMIPGGDEEDFSGNGTPENPGLRKGSTGTFAVLQGGIERIQTLPWDFSLLLHADGQWGSQPLIPAEQYFAGGMDTVRGSIQYEAIGDNAIRGRAEITTPELFSIPIDRMWQRRRSADYNLTFKFAAFYDAANLWIQQAQPGQRDQFRLEGVGG